ncbi:hypothetical protein evm_000284 [Chilo suppressalis]|nr:hypothetical protein evm_000284 [Chilo suppressalis]
MMAVTAGVQLMPKRKKDNCEHIKRKIRRLERKLERKKKHHRSRYNSSCSELSEFSYRSSPISKDDQEVIVDLDAPCSEGQPEGQSEQVLGSHLEAMQSTSHDGHSSTEAPKRTLPSDQMSAPETENIQLESEILEILGTDPTTEKRYGKEIDSNVSTRFQYWVTTGISKELRKELVDKYMTPENCKLIDPAELNPEIKAAVSDIIIKRDKAIQSKQKELTAGITCLGEAITAILSAKEKDTALLKTLMDLAKIICDCQHSDTITRRNFLLNAVKRDLRESLQNTKIDKQLFGENLTETIKSAKAINKSGTDLKQSATPKFPKKNLSSNPASSSRNLNWKGPGPSRRPTGPPRTKEPVTTLMRRRPINSSKQSQYPQQRQNNNRR